MAEIKRMAAKTARAAAASLAIVSMTATTALTPTPAFAQEHIINLRDADIRAFIDEVSMITGYTFIVSPLVKGTVTVTSQTPLTEDEVFQVFLSTLRVHGYTVIPGPSGYKIVPDQTAAQAVGPNRATGGDTIISEVIKIDFVDAVDASKIIKPLMGPQGQIQANADSNMLILVDYASNIQRLRQIVDDMDQDNSVIDTVGLRNMPASKMAQILERLKTGPGSARGDFTVLAVDANNSVLIKGEPSTVARLKAVAIDLDRSSAYSENVRVIYLKHADAQDVMPVLEQVARTVQGPEGEAQGGPKMSFHQPTNALIISADADTLRAMETIIAELDIRRAQVLVEAIIVEISDTAARELGLQYFATGTGSNGIPFSSTNFNRSAPNLLALSGAVVLDDDPNFEGSSALSALQDVALNSLLGLDGLVVGGAGQTSDGNLFGVILSAVENDTDSNVLSTPHVMTLDNEVASLIVGQEIPITTGEALGSDLVNSFRTVQRQDVGVQLEVQPQISEGDTIKLRIRQEVSSVAGVAGAADLITNKRAIETTVLADNAEIIVLGGLIEEREDVSESKVPLLGDLPWVGNAFKSRGVSRAKTNLVVFLKPTIVRNREDMRGVTSRKYDFIADQQRRSTGGESSLERAAREILGGAPTYSYDQGALDPASSGALGGESRTFELAAPMSGEDGSVADLTGVAAGSALGAGANAEPVSD